MLSLYYENTNNAIKAVKVEPFDNYTLKISFSNGKEKTFDVKPFLKYEAFLPLKDKKLFETAKIEGHTVVWNENIDIDPRRLYWEGK